MITHGPTRTVTHIDTLRDALSALSDEDERLHGWAATLAATLGRGGRLLVAGNGGSAAQAHHLAGELVGRYREDRAPFSAIALHGDGAALTAIANDYGIEEMFARQVRGHGRRGDILLLLSTSGASRNILAAARTGRHGGLRTWALTGPPGNPLVDVCDDALCVPAPTVAAVQEVHLVALHLLCEAFDATLSGLPAPGAR